MLNETLDENFDEFGEEDHPPGTIYEYLGLGCSISMIVISILGAVGNGYAVWHFGRPSGRSSVNVLLTALSTFDLILLITGTPMYSLLGIYSYDRQHVTLLALGYCMTALYPFSNMAQMGSVWTMMLISLERYLGVCHPFVARRELTVRRARLSVIFVALFATAYNLCRFWEYGLNEEGSPVPILRNNPAYVSVYVHWMYFAFVFSIPFLVIFAFNVLVMGGVRRATKNRPRCQMSVQQRGERRTTLMLLVVVAVFFACNSLAWLLNGYEMLGYQATAAAFEFVSDLNNLLVLAHPAFNIFVYARFSVKFRNEFLYCLCRHLRPSLIGSPPGSYVQRTECQNGYSPSVRRLKNYSVLDAALVRLNGDDSLQQLQLLQDRSLQSSRRNTLHKQEHNNHHQRETSVSASTTTTNVTMGPVEHSETNIAMANCNNRELSEDNRRQFLKTLGYVETSFDFDLLQGTAL